jgi:hypothetical protein
MTKTLTRDDLIRDYMSRLGRRPKNMSPAAIDQRREAGRKSGVARRAAAPPRKRAPTRTRSSATGTIQASHSKGTTMKNIAGE